LLLSEKFASTLDRNMLNCSAPSLYHGCSLFLKHGCSCLTVKSCQQAHFQFSDEAICHEEWIRRKTMWKELCLKAKCGVVFQPKCPEDSILVPAPAPEPPNCCPSPDTCHCNQEACLKHIKLCPPELELVQVFKGTDTPGRCCDIFECFPKKFGCNHVRCPPTKVEKCPEDSYRPPQVIAEKGCCPVVEECRCLAGVCPPAVCPPNHHLVVLKKGNGIPGSCCDQFQCISVEPAVNETSMICEVEKTVFNNGDTWHPKPCTECECKDGIIFCRSLLCHPPPPSCRRIQVPEGECCPICSGCETENGESRNITEQWKKDDCTTCQCSEDGQVICQRQLCSVECDNPLYMSGQCCPDQNLAVNSGTCIHVQSVVHMVLSTMPTAAHCVSVTPVLAFTTATSIACMAMRRICMDVRYVDVGVYGLNLTTHLFFQHKTLHLNGLDAVHWQDIVITVNGGSMTVVIVIVIMVENAALDRRLHRLTCHAPGGNRNYVEGEFWNLDKCTICTCHVGHVLCHRKECPPAPCAKPTITDDTCCPVSVNLLLRLTSAVFVQLKPAWLMWKVLYGKKVLLCKCHLRQSLIASERLLLPDLYRKNGYGCLSLKWSVIQYWRNVAR
ncbi:Cysteine-rich motor neuron 1 protein, partial [Trichinella pseudospiralis]